MSRGKQQRFAALRDIPYWLVFYVLLLQKLPICAAFSTFESALPSDVVTIGVTTVTTSKIRIKLGAIEVEYEGSETFLKEELPALLSAVSDLYQKSQASNFPNDDGIDSLGGSAPANGAGNLNGAGGAQSTSSIGTTTSIAARLKVNSGPELAIAAAARLALGEGRPVFTRKQLIAEMKSAPNYYKENYLKNLSSTIHRLLKDGKLNEPSTGNLTLTASYKSELESRLV